MKMINEPCQDIWLLRHLLPPVSGPCWKAKARWWGRVDAGEDESQFTQRPQTLARPELRKISGHICPTHSCPQDFLCLLSEQAFFYVLEKSLIGHSLQ